MFRKKRESHKDSFELTKEKQFTMHDDRAYTLALLAYGLQCVRRKSMLDSKPKKKIDVDSFPIRQGVVRKSIG